MEASEFKNLRCLLGLTQDELARIFSMKAQQISNYETGQYPINPAIAKKLREMVDGHDEVVSLDCNTFKELRLQIGVSQAELALKLGVSTRQIINYEKGHTPIKASIAKKMLEWSQDKSTKVTENTITSYSVPLLSIAASAGYGVMGFEIVTDGQLLLDVNIFKTPQKQENLRALKVEGDSMSPTLDNGDYVVIDMSKKRGVDGIYVLRRSNEFFVKRLQFDIISDRILIISDNKAYETKSIDIQTQEEFDILGRVVAIIKAV